MQFLLATMYDSYNTEPDGPVKVHEGAYGSDTLIFFEFDGRVIGLRKADLKDILKFI